MPEWVIKYWVEWLFGIIATLLLMGYRTMAKKIKADHERQMAIEEGMQALLRTSIIDQHNKWKDQGYFPIYARENVDFLSQAYFKLKGNGVVPDLLETLKKLPTEPRKDEENEEH